MAAQQRFKFSRRTRPVLLTMAAKQGFKFLEELDLSANKLHGPLPSEISALQNLRIFKARQNKLTVLPPEISELSRLLELHLGLNQISAVPAEMASMSQLDTLDLSDNVLEILPAELGRCALILVLFIIEENLKFEIAGLLIIMVLIKRFRQKLR